MECVSKIYADVNNQRPKEYWDYDNFRVSWNSQDHYEVVRKVGRGAWHARLWYLEWFRD